MKKGYLEQILSVLEELGEIKSRSMFGGYGLYHEGFMFALIATDKVYLRASMELEKNFLAMGLEQYVYMKNGKPVALRYYLVPEQYLQPASAFLALVKEAIELAMQEHEDKQKESQQRLKDLPNLDVSSERMLKKAGIHSYEDLKACGAIEAYRRVCEVNSNIHSLKLLWAIAGALEGCHAAILPKPVKDALLQELEATPS
ncbi:DNA transformation protein TfoX1 [Vibrio stylophorae]|uniref:DNA transformation protein TfoX1 n=1 Tax=Vibrio stylophorae TaxID=659351 RepID=A0ABM8ZS48_9VIBR|nr:TfoX/Sxy family DNA transformation protein [Vibrio stylophorae]CAH0533122.1 DNA transformation protein TfoX1 [Vibrio stylophorae]